MNRKRLLALLPLTALMASTAGCARDQEAGMDGDTELFRDTAIHTTIEADTVEMPVEIERQDTVVEVTTTEVDTIEGEPRP